MTDLSLHQHIFILPQWVQFYEDPNCLLDPRFNTLEPKHAKCSSNFNNYIIYTYICSKLRIYP